MFVLVAEASGRSLLGRRPPVALPEDGSFPAPTPCGHTSLWRNAFPRRLLLLFLPLACRLTLTWGDFRSPTGQEPPSLPGLGHSEKLEFMDAPGSPAGQVTARTTRHPAGRATFSTSTRVWEGSSVPHNVTLCLSLPSLGPQLGANCGCWQEEAVACLRHLTPRGLCWGQRCRCGHGAQGWACTAVGSQHVDTDLRPSLRGSGRSPRCQALSLPCSQATGWVPESCRRPQGGIQVRLLEESGSLSSSRCPSPPEAKIPEKERCPPTFLQGAKAKVLLLNFQTGARNKTPTFSHVMH